jgi:hypothetical protein
MLHILEILFKNNFFLFLKINFIRIEHKKLYMNQNNIFKKYIQNNFFKKTLLK